MLEVQGQNGNWDCDHYMHGLYNGMEYALSIMENREPKFRSSPKKWLFTYARWQKPVVFISRIYDKFYNKVRVFE